MTVAAAGGGASAYLNTVSAANVDAVVDVSYDKAATGGGFYTSLVVRRIGTSDYRVKVRVDAHRHPGVPRPHGERGRDRPRVRCGARHVRTRLGAACPSPGHRRRNDHAHGEGVVQTSPEPATWTLTATDSTASLQSPGAVGIYTYISGSATNAPMKTFIDNLSVGAL